MRTLITTTVAAFMLICLLQISAGAQNRRYADRRYHDYDRGYNNRNYSYYNYGYNNYGYNTYRNYGYYPYSGRRVYLNRPSVVLSFGGNPYNYLDGNFYRPYGSYFEMVIPPVGIHVNLLPRGYRRVWVGPNDYYYYQGTFYRHSEDYYEVIAPPVGAEVAELPEGATAIVIDNKKYYQFQGIYFKETIKQDGEIWYTVTGKKGVMTSEPSAGIPQYNYPRAGAEVSRLPEGCKTVVINNQKYFVSADDIYYQEKIDNNQIYYKVVEKPVSLGE
jgi:uncharacterized protein DUF6515